MSAMVSVPTVVRIAANVFKESVRDKVLYSIVLFAVLIIAASFLLGQLTAGQEVKIIKDLGLVGDLAVRPFHRHLHRHRPGVEGSGAAQHLRAAGQADEPHRAAVWASSSACVSTLAVNVSVMTAWRWSPCSPSTPGVTPPETGQSVGGAGDRSRGSSWRRS